MFRPYRTDDYRELLPEHLHRAAEMFFFQIVLDILEDEELTLIAKVNTKEKFFIFMKNRIDDAIVARFLKNQDLAEQIQKDPAIRDEMATRVYEQLRSRSKENQ
jgi:hypothetical protein